MDASSYDAYQAMIANGKLGKAQREVLIALLQGGPQTGGEINRWLGTPNAQKRLSELAKRGFIETPNEAVCPVTHRKAKVWRARLDRIPSNPIMQISTDQKELLRKQGLKRVSDATNGPSIYVAMVDGIPLKASASQTKIMEYCRETGIPMWKMRPSRIWEFHNPTASAVFNNEIHNRVKRPKATSDFEDLELFPECEG